MDRRRALATAGAATLSAVAASAAVVVNLGLLEPQPGGPGSLDAGQLQAATEVRTVAQVVVPTTAPAPDATLGGEPATTTASPWRTWGATRRPDASDTTAVATTTEDVPPAAAPAVAPAPTAPVDPDDDPPPAAPVNTFTFPGSGGHPPQSTPGTTVPAATTTAPAAATTTLAPAPTPAPTTAAPTTTSAPSQHDDDDHDGDDDENPCDGLEGQAHEECEQDLKGGDDD